MPLLVPVPPPSRPGSRTRAEPLTGLQIASAHAGGGNHRRLRLEAARASLAAVRRPLGGSPHRDTVSAEAFWVAARRSPPARGSPTSIVALRVEVGAEGPEERRLTADVAGRLEEGVGQAGVVGLHVEDELILRPPHAVGVRVGDLVGVDVVGPAEVPVEGRQRGGHPDALAQELPPREARCLPTPRRWLPAGPRIPAAEGTGAAGGAPRWRRSGPGPGAEPPTGRQGHTGGPTWRPPLLGPG